MKNRAIISSLAEALGWGGHTDQHHSGPSGDGHVPVSATGAAIETQQTVPIPPSLPPDDEEPTAPSEVVDDRKQRVATPLTASNFRLLPRSSAGSGERSYSSVIADLNARLPNVSVSTVLSDTNRAAVACTADADHLLTAFCWNDGDNAVPYWIPQGITTSADAYNSGVYDGNVAILVSWYDNGSSGTDRGVRVSFVNYTDPQAPAYRHVLLVEPYDRIDGVPSYRAIRVHAGGIFWYGDLLYVADTQNGFRVFDLRQIWRVDTSNATRIGWQADGSYQAYGYKYVLPQSLRYAGSTIGGYSDLRYSFAALDRTSTPDSVLVGEYAYPGDGTRVARFPIDYADRRLLEDSDGYVRATEAYDVSLTSMQGVTAIDGKFYLSTSDGDADRGDLVTFRSGEDLVVHRNVLPIGPEDVSYWGAADQLWSVTEYAGTRSVFAIRASAY